MTSTHGKYDQLIARSRILWRWTNGPTEAAGRVLAWPAWVFPTNKQLMIARHTERLPAH